MLSELRSCVLAVLRSVMLAVMLAVMRPVRCDLRAVPLIDAHNSERLNRQFVAR